MVKTNQLHAILGTMDAGLIAYDQELTILAANAQARDVLGLPAAMLRPGASFRAIVRYAAERGDYGPGNTSKLFKKYLALASGTEPHTFDRHLPDGTVIEIRGRPVPDGGFVVTYTDVTERLRVENELKRKNAMLEILQRIAEAANQAFTTKEAILRGLEEVCAFTGWPIGHAYVIENADSRDLVSSGIWHFDQPKRFVRLKAVTEGTRMPPGVGLPGRILISREPAWIFDVTSDPNFPRANIVEDIGVKAAFAFPVMVGEDVEAVLEFFSETALPPDNTLLEIMRSVGTQIGRVVERERASAALRNASEKAGFANRAKSEFLANMSHELRTPLNAIIGFAELLQTDAVRQFDDDRRRQYLDDIANSGKHLLSLINDILDISKIEAGRLTLNEEDVALEPLIKASIRIVEQRAGNLGIELIREKTEDIPLIRADPRAVKQMLFNLMSNSVKFTERGGRITVRAGKDTNGGVTVSVSDTGIGMSAGEIETALQPFGQVESAYTRRFAGTGLGIPLVKALAEHHGASFGIESQPGVGTTATVQFPPERSLAPGSRLHQSN